MSESRSTFIFRLAVFGSLAWLVMQSAQAGERLTLDRFLQQVRSRNQGVQASQLIAEGSAQRADEAELQLAPTFFATGQVSHDAQPPRFPGLNYERLDSTGYQIGVSKLFGFGLSAKLSYQLSDFNYVGLPFGLKYEGRPALELTQSFWRNGFGAEVRAGQELARASALAQSYGQRFQTKVALAQAESLYWRLALARENVGIQKDALDRAQKIYDWNARRARLQLADRSDLLQAQAALEVRKLQQQAALDEERAAARAFNSARGEASDQVPDALASLETDLIRALSVPERAGPREDVQAAEQQSLAAAANARLAREKDAPTLDAFATLALNSQDPSRGTALSESFRTDRPTTVFGVRFSAPLDLGLLSRSRAGWEKEEAGAQLSFERKRFEADREWTDLSERLRESKSRYELSRAIEAAQKRKLDRERERLNIGRSTTYQVLLFEQDYAQAQLSRIQAQAEVLNLVAQLKLFAAAPGAGHA
jgi:outer membrane protein TolC